jgi:type I restriction enzyme M protein
MNMILHDNETADIEKGDTITSPQFTSGSQLRTFDFIVMNPPFSTKSWSSGLELDYSRFEYGRPPEKNGDYAFLLHVLKSLKSTGKAAIILPHGVLFRGYAEGTIRRELLRRGYIKGVIGLPPNLFYGTSIPACIVVLDKENAQVRKGVFMIDASKGFVKDGPKNRLRSQDIHKIVDVFNKQIEVDRYSRMIPMHEISGDANSYNLNITRYIDSSDPEDLQDLAAHIHGGIPERDIDALKPYWDAFSRLRTTLFKSNRPGYVDLAVEPTHVQQTILDSDEFKSFTSIVRALANTWFEAHRAALETIKPDTRPNDLIVDLGDDLLARFKPTALLDEYDVYEQFMTYWHGTMHDDVFLIMNDGWSGASKPRKTIEDKDRKFAETPDLVIGSGRSAIKYKMDLVPPSLIVAHYFPGEQAKLDELNLAVEEASHAVQEYLEEHAVDEGLLEDATGESGKVTKVSAATRLKLARYKKADPEEILALQHVIDLFNAESVAKATVKEAQEELDTATLKQYAKLTEDDVKAIVIDDKWQTTITARITSEVESLTLDLVARTKELGERYGETASDLSITLAELESKVASHLAAMGVM